MTGFRLAFLACLVAALPALEVTSFTLIDADTDQPVSAHDPLVDGATVDFAAIGTSNLNVRANVSGTVGSVVFDLDSGATTQTENQAPYALAGDSSGDYDAWTPSEGSHTLVATPYDGGDGGGTAGTAHSIAFDVVADGGGGGTTDPGGTDGDGTITVAGDLRRWHKVTLDIDGPWAAETGDPNPFLDYRLRVTFTNGSLTYVVPGYFAADGDAANTSANSGTIWRAHLCPDLTGTWSYTVSMRQGASVAVSDDPNAGTPVAGIDGATGTFDVAETDKGGRDFRGKGRLEYVGEHHLRFAGSGEWFVKGGADAPENFLGYYEFDQTSDQGGKGPNTPDGLHHYDPHLGDWQSGDPTWQSGKGKRIVGALNYLASTGSNVFSFLTYNSGGDGQDVWPHAAYDDRLRFDCSKLDQWEIVFAHAQRKGLYLHFKTQETENDNGTWGLDGGAVGTERKLYYRELVARYAHHLALNWNLGEENTQTDQQRKDMAQYFYDVDPYHHHIVVHTYPGDHDKVYTPLLGDASKLTGPSIQTGWTNVHGATRTWIANSAAAGKKWVVANDEQGGANTGIRPDYDWPDSNTTLAQNEDQRHQVLWGNLMAGGAGVEAYFGYSLPHSDMTCEDWRSRDDWFRACGHALAFFQTHLPFQEMQGADPLVGNGNHSGSGRYCLAKTGRVYAVYLPDGGPADLDLSGVSGTFEVRWYDPRNGGSLQTGSVTAVSGGATVNLGSPPSATDEDWACLVRLSSGGGNLPPSVNAGPDASVSLPDSLALSGSAGDPDDDPLVTTWSQVSGPGTATFADPSALATTASFDVGGTYVLRLSADDGTDTASDDLTVEVADPASFRDPDDPSGATGGIAYEEYHTGALSQLPDFSTMTPVATGTTDVPGVHVRTRDDDFALVFTGYVDVPADDTWTFSTTSDDGSKLYVGSQLVVDNDGTHSKRERSGSIGLKAGLHAIRVEFFERGGGEVLEVRWQSSGTSEALIPAGSYFHAGGASNAAPTASVAATPTSGEAPLDVAFDASGSSDADGTIQGYAWDFGDGATGTGATPTHTYSTAGSYAATVTVTDDDGATDTASVTIDVAAPPPTGALPWVEDFAGLADGTTADAGATAWSVDVSATSSPIFEVRTGEFFSQDTDGEAVWRSQTIDISGAGSVDVSLAIRGEGGLDGSGDYLDYLRVFYVLDGGAEVQIAERTGGFNGGAAETVVATGLNGTSLAVVVRTLTTGPDESYHWDDVSVVAATATNQAPTAAASAVPTSGTAPLEVAFDASGSSDVDGAIQSYAWDFGDGATGTGATPTHTYSAAGSYAATVTVTDDDGATDQASVNIDVTESTGDLPWPWVAEDVGNVAAAGSTAHASGTWTVQGSGNDIWNQADEFHFVHQPISGDVTITARVQSLTNTHQWAKAGVMVRQSTAADSTHAMCVQTVDNGVSFQRRTGTGSSSDHTSGNAETTPSWVRMQRSGSTLTASTSEDGSTWTVIGSVDIAMTDPVEVGLCVTAHNDGALCEAVFTDVAVVSSGGGNSAPVVDAGTNASTTLPNDTVSLDGTVSDPDGDTLTTSWSLSSGPGAVTFGDPNAVDTTATFSTDGIYVLELAAGDGAVTSTDTVSITVEPEPTGGTVVLAVNGGGGTYTAVDGTAYDADTGVANGGKTYSTTAAIGATEDDPVYRSERYGNFSYAASLPDGDYEITFQFAEIYWTGSGKRVFDVAVEGALVIDDLDIYVAAGGKDVAYEVVVPVTITDGVLDVDFVTVKDNAKCSGMVVRTAAPTSNG